jgi:hypothetical protein
MTKGTDVRVGSWLRENVEIEFANGNFVSTSINLKNKSAGEGCRDKTIEKTILRAFRARTFSRSQGQSLPYRAFRAMSGLLPAATELRTSRVVRFVPAGDIMIIKVEVTRPARSLS